MRTDEETALMLLALAAMVGGRKVDVPWGTGWMWPVPTLRIGNVNYDAVASHEFEPSHHGLDIMYRRKSASDLVQVYRPGTHDGNAKFFAPPRTPVLAARDGKIYDVVQWENGWAIVLDHGPLPFATAYLHIETPGVPIHRNGRNVATGVVGTRVRAGDIIGFMGYDPSQADSAHLRHLHFEVHYKGSWNNAVDPEAAMRTWARPPFVFKP